MKLILYRLGICSRTGGSGKRDLKNHEFGKKSALISAQFVCFRMGTSYDIKKDERRPHGIETV